MAPCNGMLAASQSPTPSTTFSIPSIRDYITYAAPPVIECFQPSDSSEELADIYEHDYDDDVEDDRISDDDDNAEDDFDDCETFGTPLQGSALPRDPISIVVSAPETSALRNCSPGQQLLTLTENGLADCHLNHESHVNGSHDDEYGDDASSDLNDAFSASSGGEGSTSPPRVLPHQANFGAKTVCNASQIPCVSTANAAPSLGTPRRSSLSKRRRRCSKSPSRLPRSSSSASPQVSPDQPQTPASSPINISPHPCHHHQRSKTVHFADAAGMALSAIRTMTPEPDSLVNRFLTVSGASPVSSWINSRLKNQRMADSRLLTPPNSSLSPVLTTSPPSQPKPDYLRVDSILPLGVKVDSDSKPVSLSVLRVRGCEISGEILVANVAFNKRVSVRVTMDRWRSFRDHPARWSGNSVSQPDAERFTFSFSVPIYLQPGSPIELCLRYELPDTGLEYWDNNSSENYRLTFLGANPDQVNNNLVYTANNRLLPDPFANDCTTYCQPPSRSIIDADVEEKPPIFW